MSVTKDTIAYREKNNIKRNILIDMKNSEENFSIEDAAAQIFLFFANGFEPSASTMANCLYELSLNQDLQTALRDEIQNSIENNGGEVTYDLIVE
uniref:Cytochrome P450 n=1 Tax=Megaselia scalaris TaxID=36166 RepID=T1GRM8_MEGSC